MDEKTILKYALQNAVKFKGKANPGAVIGKIFAEDPELKKKAAELSKKVNEILKKVNGMSPDKQQKKLEDFKDELPEKKAEIEKDIFKFLNIKDGTKVVTAFPPGVEKYPHIGHAKACLINYLLAEHYKGKFKLRFEDTNPKLVKKEFYDIMIDNFKWLGIHWASLDYASDHMELYYKHAEQLIKEGKAYMCFCNGDEIKLSRSKGVECKHRSQTPEENMKFWQSFPSYKEGKAILRLKIDLKHKNSTMRDPTIFRVIEGTHARHKNKYKVWPNYDFQTAIMDSHLKITHRLRSKEFEMRNELQRYIQSLLNYPETNIYEFARFNMKGVPSSGRIIREMLEKKELIGWDDPSLTTLVALRRRGFHPEAIKNFVISTGITKSESTMTWDDLIMHNRRLLDDVAPRYSAIFDPVQMEIDNVPEMKVSLHLNPNKKEGGRVFKIKGDFILSKEDVEKMKNGEVVRLMDCINVMKDKAHVCFDSVKFEDFKGKGKKVINWLPAEDNIDIEILMPDKKIVKGVAEHNIEKLKEGDVIQFVRFGFCRLDKKLKNKYLFWFTHK